MNTCAEYERVWAEVDLGAIRHNYRLAKALSGTAVLPVIKADAYGHGALAVAAALAAEGAAHFGVATADEALALRRADVDCEILVLGAVPPARVAELAAARVSVCVPSLRQAQSYSDELWGDTLRVHIKIDTGMARLGLPKGQAAGQALAIAALPGLVVEGLFTHFAVADESACDAFTKGQFAALLAVRDALRAEGHRVVCHAANSAGVLRLPEVAADMVRPGIMLYGCAPGPECENAALRPAMALRARVACVQKLAAGEAVSYGQVWRAERDSRIAVVSAGYADGIPRVASGGFSALVRGQAAPQVGRVCMDMCMLDVTAIPDVQEGEVATFFGQDGDASLPVESFAAAAGTISYEQLCAVSARVPRVYLGGGEA